MDTTEASDSDLLAAFVSDGSEKAFTSLVHRHIGLVYSAAFQKLRDSHRAEDVAQAVFVLLARKASRISSRTVLAGWLYRTAQYIANDTIKTERRRLKREEICREPEGAPSQDGNAEAAAGLDHALARLPEQDRLAILLRYFEQKSIREVGSALQIGEEAARKRIDRAVDKLRSLLHSKRGVVSASEAIDLLSQFSKGGPPEGAAVRAATAGLAATSVLSDSVLELVRAALRAMWLAKLKRILAIAAPLTLLPLLFAGFWLNQDPAPNAKTVIDRHFAAVEASRFRAGLPVDRDAGACLKCHRPGEPNREVSVRGICLRGEWRSTRESLAGTFEINLAGPRRVMERVQIGPGFQVRARNASYAWTAPSQGSSRFLNSEETAKFQSETTFLFWREPGSFQDSVQRSVFDGLLSYRLRTSKEADFYFEKASGLFRGSVWRGAERCATNVLGDFHDFHGLLAPTRIARLERGVSELLLVESVELREFPLKIFDPPPELHPMTRAVQ